MCNISDALLNIKQLEKKKNIYIQQNNKKISPTVALGAYPEDVFPFSVPEFLRSAMITSMKGQGKCSQTFRVYTVNQPRRRKMFLFVFVSFLPSKDSTIVQCRPTPTDTGIVVKIKKRP